MPRCAATRRASSRSRGPQQRPPADAGVPRASYKRIETPTTRSPASTSSAAAVALSTPPESATTVIGWATAVGLRYIPPMIKGDRVTLTIDTVDAEGAGVGAVAAADGERRVHVPFTLPGERVEAEVEHVSLHSADAWAALGRVLAPSEARVEP